MSVPACLTLCIQVGCSSVCGHLVTPNMLLSGPLELSDGRWPCEPPQSPLPPWCLLVSFTPIQQPSLPLHSSLPVSLLLRLSTSIAAVTIAPWTPPRRVQRCAYHTSMNCCCRAGTPCPPGTAGGSSRRRERRAWAASAATPRSMVGQRQRGLHPANGSAESAGD